MKPHKMKWQKMKGAKYWQHASSPVPYIQLDAKAVQRCILEKQHAQPIHEGRRKKRTPGMEETIPQQLLPTQWKRTMRFIGSQESSVKNKTQLKEEWMKQFWLAK